VKGGAVMLVKVSVSVFLFAAGVYGADVFDFRVERIRMFKDEPGNLHIDAGGVTFRSANGKTTIEIAMKDLRTAEVADPTALRFERYELRKWKPIERRAYTFRAQPGAPLEDLAQFLSARILRPVVGHYGKPAEFQTAAYHKRGFGGTHGTLEIGAEAIRFVSDNPTDSRTWLYRDIETIGAPDRLHFRVTTLAETYILELKAELSEAAYQLAWKEVYKP